MINMQFYLDLEKLLDLIKEGNKFVFYGKIKVVIFLRKYLYKNFIYDYQRIKDLQIFRKI